MSPSRNIYLASRQWSFFDVTSLLTCIQESLQIAEFTLHIVHNLFQDGDSRFVIRQSKGGICIDICICISGNTNNFKRRKIVHSNLLQLLGCGKIVTRPNQSGEISVNTFSCKNFQMYKTVFLKHKGTAEIPKEHLMLKTANTANLYENIILRL